MICSSEKRRIRRKPPRIRLCSSGDENGALKKAASRTSWLGDAAQATGSSSYMAGETKLVVRTCFFWRTGDLTTVVYCVLESARLRLMTRSCLATPASSAWSSVTSSESGFLTPSDTYSADASAQQATVTEMPASLRMSRVG